MSMDVTLSRQGSSTLSEQQKCMPGRHIGTVVEEVEHLLELILKLLYRGERRYDAVALAVAPQAPLLGRLEGSVRVQGITRSLN